MTTLPALAPARVARLWPGERVVILGGGSSLTPEDVDACRGKAHVIAIKEAVQLAPWAEVLYAADAKWWRFYHGVTDFAGLKYAIEQDVDQVRTQWEDWGITVLRATGTEGLELDASGLRTGYNSGYQAVNLAYHLAGAATVILLGFDMWTGPSGQQNWFGAHPLHTKSPYPIFLHAFRTLAGPARAAGLRIINASRFTVLASFPRLSLEEALTC